MFNRVKYKLCQSSLLRLYNSLIYPQLNYCNILWGCASKSVLNPVIILQKRAIRIVCHANYIAHTGVLAKKMGIIKLVDVNLLQTAVFVFKYISNSLPTVCADFLIENNRTRNPYDLRNTNAFLIPSYRTSLREKCSLVRFPRIWNAIPNEIKHSESLNIFKSRLKQYLSSKY